MSRLLTSEEADDFRKLLKSYKLRNDGLQQFIDSNFAVVAGPAGAGKDTLRNELVKRYPQKYTPILSTTTRPPRQGEQDGVTYYFREVDEVKEKLLKQNYFQAELVHNQQISCLDIEEIEKLQPGQWGLSILITETEAKLSQIKPDIKTIFLIPPSLDLLTKRMQAERMLNPEEIDRRLSAAKNELEQAIKNENYYCMVSDTVENVVNYAHAFFQDGKQDRTIDSAARQVIEKILSQLSRD